MRRRFASLSLIALLSPVLGLAACATGSEDSPFESGPKGAVDPNGSGSTGEPGGGTETGGDPSGDGSAGVTGGGDDGGGDPACCEAHGTPGCDSAQTEACVCTHTPDCCQSGWTQECADLAYGCGDPYCQGSPAGTEGGESGETGELPMEETGGEPPPPPPPPECECLGGVDNFCLYGPSYPDCSMTAPGGYCDPNGDGDFTDGDWEQGYFHYLDECG